MLPSFDSYRNHHSAAASPTARSLSTSQQNGIILEGVVTKQWLSKRYQHSVKDTTLLKQDKNHVQHSGELVALYNELAQSRECSPQSTERILNQQSQTTQSTNPVRKLLVKDFAQFLKQGDIDISNTSELAEVLVGKRDAKQMINLQDFQRIIMSQTLHKKFQKSFQTQVKPNMDDKRERCVKKRVRSSSISEVNSLGNIVNRIHFQSKRDKLIENFNKLQAPQLVTGQNILMAKCAVLENLICLPQHSNVKQKLNELHFKNAYVRQKEKEQLIEQLSQQNTTTKQSIFHSTALPKEAMPPSQNITFNARKKTTLDYFNLHPIAKQQTLREKQLPKTVPTSPRQSSMYYLPRANEQPTPSDLPGFKFNRVSKHAFPREFRKHSSVLQSSGGGSIDDSSQKAYKVSETTQATLSPKQEKKCNFTAPDTISSSINFPSLTSMKNVIHPAAIQLKRILQPQPVS